MTKHKIPATYTSVFDGGRKFTTECWFFPFLKLVCDIDDVGPDGEDNSLNALTDEYVTVDGKIMRKEDGVTFDY